MLGYLKEIKNNPARLPPVLRITYWLFAVTYALTVFGVARKIINGIASGVMFKFELSSSGPSIRWLIMNVFSEIGVEFLMGVTFVFFAMLLTWIYSAFPSKRPSDCPRLREHLKISYYGIWNLSWPMKCLIIACVVFFLLALFSGSQSLAGFLETAFNDMNGAGPLIGILFGPILFVVYALACVGAFLFGLALIIAGLLLPGMLSYLMAFRRCYWIVPGMDMGALNISG